jgi:tetratricopeptide (TPR) repeat protein
MTIHWHKFFVSIAFFFVCEVATAGPLEEAGASFSERDFLSAQVLFSGALTEVFLSEEIKYTEDFSEEIVKKALSEYGWTLFSLGQYEASKIVFIKLSGLDENSFGAALGIAWNAVKLEDPDAAAHLNAAKKLGKKTEVPSVYDALGWLALNNKDFKAAKKYFKKEEKGIISAFGVAYSPDPKVGQAWLEIHQGNWRKAEKAFKIGLRRDPNCLYCRDGLARVSLQAGKLKKALIQAKEGAKLARHNYGLVALVSEILFKISDVQTSIDTYRDLADAHKGDDLWNIRLSAALVESGNTKSGKKILLGLLADNPKSTAVLGALDALRFQERNAVSEGWSLYAEGKYSESLRYCERLGLTLKDEGNAAAEDCRGWALLALDRVDAAAVAFETALSIDPTFVFSKAGIESVRKAKLIGYTYAWSLLEAGKYQEAIDKFNSARIGLNSELDWLIGDGLAWVDYYRGNNSRARTQFEAVISKNAKAYLSQRGLALILLDDGNYKRAGRLLLDSFEQAPNQSIAIYSGPIVRLIDSEHYPEASNILRIAEQVWPLSADIKVLFGRALLGLGEEPSAAEKFLKAVRLAPTYINPVFDDFGLSVEASLGPYLALGWGLYYSGLNSQSRARFQSYLDGGGEDRSGYLGLGLVELALGNTVDAEKLLNKAQTFGDGAEVLAGLGWVDIANGNMTSAQARFDGAIALTPGHLWANQGIAAIKYKLTEFVQDGWNNYFKGNYLAALSVCVSKQKEARSIKNPAAADCQGWSLLAMDRPEEAEEAFKVALSIDPDFFYSRSGLIASKRAGLVHYNQAWSLAVLGRYEEAGKKFEQSKAGLDEEIKWLVDEGLAWLALYEGDLVTARGSFNDILVKEPAAYLSNKGLGYTALLEGDWEEAVDQLGLSYKLAPYQAISSYTEPARSFIKSKKFKEALVILNSGENIWPLSADIKILLSTVHKELQDVDLGAEYAVRAASLAPLYIDEKFDELGFPPEKVKVGILALGWGLYRAGRSRESLQRFDSYFNAGGQDTSGYLGRGWASLALSQNAKASVAFLAALDMGINADAHTGLGYLALSENRNEDAEFEFKAALEIAPSYAVALSGLSTLKFQQTKIVSDGWNSYWKGDYESALQSCSDQRGAAAKSKNAAAEDCRGWSLLSLGRYEQAKEAFENALKIDPGFFYSSSGLVASHQAGMTLYKESWELIREGLWADASSLLEEAQSEIDINQEWLIADAFAWIKFYKKDYDVAEAMFSAIVLDHPLAYLSHNGLGYIAVERGEYEEAVSHLTTSISIAPYQPISSYLIPVVKLLDAEKFQGVDSILGLAERAWPLSADIKFLRARASHGLGNIEALERLVLGAAGLAPVPMSKILGTFKIGHDAQKKLDTILAWGLYFSGYNEGAVRHFDKYLAAGGDDPNARRGKGFAVFRLGRYDEAITTLNDVIQFETSNQLKPVVEYIAIPGAGAKWPLSYNAGSTLAWALLRQGSYPEAERNFRNVLEKWPFWIDALTGLGYCLEAQGKKVESLKQFKAALQLSPTYPDALKGYALASVKE